MVPEAALETTREGRGKLIEKFAGSCARFKAALAKVPAGGRKWRPAPGKWSVHEIVCHCGDAEMNAASRLRFLLAEEKPLIVGYDQDGWARKLDYHATQLGPSVGKT